jgi:hypothetical protein
MQQSRITKMRWMFVVMIGLRLACANSSQAILSRILFSITF